MSDATNFDSFSLPARRRDAHKGNFGKVLIIAGSVGFTGAPAFAARAAVRSGAGLVYLGVPEQIYAVEAVKLDEAMVFPLPGNELGALSAQAVPEVLLRLDKCDACLIGPGLGAGDETASLVLEVLSHSKVPVIVDADGITAVAKHIDILRRASSPVILTPHEGEFRRLSPKAGSGDRVTETRDFAIKHNVILVRKGHRTLTAFPDGDVIENHTGNPGMAKGGSGDVLAGMLPALLCQGIPLKRAVPAGVYFHGLAGDRCAARFGEYAMTPSDMIEMLREVLR